MKEEPNIDVPAAYDAALGPVLEGPVLEGPVLEAHASDPLHAWPEATIAEVRRGWVSGVPLAEITMRTGLHYRQIMEIVRLLRLPERCPGTLALVPSPSPPAPLPPELLAH